MVLRGRVDEPFSQEPPAQRAEIEIAAVIAKALDDGIERRVRAEPVYETLPGWSEDISAAKSFDELPKNAQAYVKALEEMSGAPVSAIGVGPGRDETIQINAFL